MFCPQCRCGYVEEVFECADCHVPLVHEQPPEPKKNLAYIEYVPVLATQNNGDLAFMKAVLTAEGIEHFAQGEHFNAARPLAIPVRLMVRKEQAERARELLSDSHFQFSALNFSGEPHRYPPGLEGFPSADPETAAADIQRTNETDKAQSCSYCGIFFEQDARFCSVCGKPRQ